MAEAPPPTDEEGLLSRFGSVTNFLATVGVIGLSFLILFVADGGDDNAVPAETEPTTTTTTTLPPLDEASPSEFVGIVFVSTPSTEVDVEPELDYSIVRIDSTTGEEIETLHDPRPNLRLSSLSASTSSVAFVSQLIASEGDNCQSRVRRLTTQGLVTLGTGAAITLSPDDRSLAIWDPCTLDDIRITNLGTGEFWLISTSGFVAIDDMSWSPDSRTLLVSAAVDGSGLTEMHTVRPGEHTELGPNSVGSAHPFGGHGVIFDDGSTLVSSVGALERYSVGGVTTIMEDPLVATSLASGWAAPWVIESRTDPEVDDWGTDTVIYRIVNRAVEDLRSLGRLGLVDAAWGPVGGIEAQPLRDP